MQIVPDEWLIDRQWILWSQGPGIAVYVTPERAREMQADSDQAWAELWWLRGNGSTLLQKLFGAKPA